MDILHFDPEKRAVFSLDPLLQRYVLSLFKNPDESDEKACAFADMIRSVRPRNPITGFFSGEAWKTDLREAFRQIRKLKENDQYDTMVVRVSGDVSNLRTLNTALNGGNVLRSDASHEPSAESDKLLSIFANIFKNGLNAASQELDPTLTHNCYCYQEGGDELGALLVVRKKKGTSGTIHDVLDQCIHKIETDTYALSCKLGLQDLVHKKYPNAPARRGVGIALSFSEIGPLTDLDKLEEHLENEIEQKKNRSPEDKWIKMVEELKLARGGNADDWYDRETKRSGNRGGFVYADGMVVEIEPERLDVIKEDINRMHAELLPEMENQKIGVFPDLNTAVPDSVKKEAGWAWVNPACERQWLLNHTMKTLNFTEEERGFMKNLYQLYEENRTRDGVISDSPAVVVDRYMDVRKNLPRRPVFAFAFEVQNFTGLNTQFGHAGCNEIVDGLLKQIRAVLGEKGKDAIIIRPELKGSLFYLVVPDMDQNRIIEVVNKINNEVRLYEDFWEVRQLPNIRHPDNPALRGLKIACGAVRIGGKTDRNGAQVVTELLRQIERMKSMDGNEPLPDPRHLREILDRCRGGGGGNSGMER